MATLFTYPLAMQPVASIFEQALIRAGLGQASAAVAEGGYGALGAADNSALGEPVVTAFVQTPVDPRGNGSRKGGGAELSPVMRYGLRVALVLFTGVCATSVPNFGVVVELLGSFSVTLGSFVLPPLFHFAVFRERLSPTVQAADCALVLLGAVTCIFTTTTTALGVIYGD